MTRERVAENCMILAQWTSANVAEVMTFISLRVVYRDDTEALTRS